MRMYSRRMIPNNKMVFFARNEMNSGGEGVRLVPPRERREIEFTNKMLSDPVLLSQCEKMTDKQWAKFLDTTTGSIRCAK